MGTRWWPKFLIVALSWAIAGSAVMAQDVRRARPGDGPGGLPALVRVPAAGLMPTGVVLVTHAGYGFTEGVLANDDAHHRLSGALAASVRPVGWLGVALRLNGHFDSHSGSAGADSGLIGEARLAARASTDLPVGLAVGVEAVLFIPGKGAPSLDFGATTLDASGLFSWAPSPTVSLDATFGVRLDNSGSSVPERDRLSRADRLALGLSDSNALLVGLGASYRLPSAELVAELTADLLVGSRAPPLGQSPIRVAAGARIPFASGLHLSVLAEAALSSRPPLADGDALSPVEPRISLLVGLVWEALRLAEPDADDDDDEGAAATTHPTDTTTHATTHTNPQPAAPRGRVTGIVRDEHDAPLAGATVSVEGEAPAVQATTDAAGAYTLEGVPVGRELRLHIAAPGRSDSIITVIANTDASVDAGDVVLGPSLPAGVIRGVVRSLRGHDNALANARIAVEPGGQSARADERGEFEIQVPPGTYEVTIEAEGHTSQQRTVTVEQLGVTVLNVDLRRRHGE